MEMTPPDERWISLRMLPRDYPTLPSAAVLDYLGEGAANVIYRVTVPASNPGADGPNQTPAMGGDDPAFWRGKLLRLRKDLPHTVLVEDQHEDTKNFVHTHFRDSDIIQQSLIKIKSSGAVDRLNKALRLMEQPSCSLQRLEKRKGSYLADDEHGLVVQDMTTPSGYSLIEFKPKWLVQSPAAPRGSKRCRTCAKRARDNMQLKSLRKQILPYFCPLDLISEDDDALLRAAKCILQIDLPSTSSRYPQASISAEEHMKIGRFIAWAKNSRLLKLLKDMQRLMDSKGVFLANPHDKSFRAAMTLRDCSVYLTIPDDWNGPITAKLGDLDLKRPNKLPYWQDIERPLVEEGWYLGTETYDKDISRFPTDLDCYLYPLHWTRDGEKENLEVKDPNWL